MNGMEPKIIDLSDGDPDCREWQELMHYIQSSVRQIVREIVESEKSDEGLGEMETQHSQERELIRLGLERYRTEPPGSKIRKCIDILIQRHAKWEGIMAQDSFFRKRHNALVLEYIISKPMTRREIQKKLGMNDNTYRSQIEKGISELSQILFVYIE